MSCRYYDDIIIAKLKKWVPESSNLRVLKPEESKRLFELIADDSNDAPFKLPFIALSRDSSINLLTNIKTPKSYDGLTIDQSKKETVQMNVIPIELNYQLDIYTKTYEEGDEYLRSFLFKLINNPKIVIEVPYNGMYIKHIANIRVNDSVSDTSDISEHIFAGQFTRWSIQFSINDAFLFNVPYRQNWRLWVDDETVATLDISENIELTGDLENIKAK